MLTGVRSSAQYQAWDEHNKCGFSSLNLSQMILSLFFGKISFILPSCKNKCLDITTAYSVTKTSSGLCLCRAAFLALSATSF